MEKNRETFCLEVWGDYACFTRPEFKVERVSYDIITPSAARAIFEAILWKWAIKWSVNRIEVLNPIKWTSIRRNEVGALMGRKPLYIEDNRQQRNALMLKDVRYRIWATMTYIPPEKRKRNTREPGADESLTKYVEMFTRRARGGQCYNQPYLGCREFSAGFRLVEKGEEMCPPIEESRDLQYMLYDMDFEKNTERPDPIFFKAEMRNGVVEVPMSDSKELIR